MDDYGNKIATHRKEKGWTQKELGEHMGTSRKTIQNWELGEKKPTAGRGIELAELFNDPTLILPEEEAILEKKVLLEELGMKYGNDAMVLAKHHIDNLAALFAGGKLEPEDKKALIKAVLRIIEESY